MLDLSLRETHNSQDEEKRHEQREQDNFLDKTSTRGDVLESGLGTPPGSPSFGVQTQVAVPDTSDLYSGGPDEFAGGLDMLFENTNPLPIPQYGQFNHPNIIDPKSPKSKYHPPNLSLCNTPSQIPETQYPKRHTSSQLNAIWGNNK